MVIVALFTKAWNSLFCAHDLALRGYYGQALNLLRQPVKDWAAYWYLRVFPDRWEQFTEESERTPRFDEMLRDIEEAHEKPKDLEIRDWMKGLHKFSHVDRLSVRAVLDIADESLHYALGPCPQEWPFRFCTSHAIAVGAVLLDALDNFVRVMGRQPAVDAHLDRVIAWQQEQVRGNPEHADEFAETLAQEA